MRELAYIETIKTLKPIPNADQIECAEILGWECVVRKNEFKVGDLVIYCEVDSTLPDLPPFEFLRPRKFRIRTIRLKSQISQGLVLPLSTLTQVDPSFNLTKLKVGQDVTEALKIVKYDPEVALDNEPQVKKSWLANKWSFIKWKLFGIKLLKNKNEFPTHLVPKTDEERVQKMAGLLSKHAGEPVYISEKLEGSSATFIYRKGGNWITKLLGKDYIFQICSRNRVVYSSSEGGDTNHSLYQIADKYQILEGLKKLDRNLAIQGESLGPKIQQNIYKLPDLDFRVFLVYDLDTKKYLHVTKAMNIVEALELQFVPIVKFYDPLINGIKHYVKLSKGKSQLNPKIDREGIVVRATDGSFSFKSISPEYLLKQE